MDNHPKTPNISSVFSPHFSNKTLLSKNFATERIETSNDGTLTKYLSTEASPSGVRKFKIENKPNSSMNYTQTQRGHLCSAKQLNSLNSDAFLNLKNIRIKKPKKKKNPKKALKQKKTYSSNTLSKPLTFLIADTLEKFKEKKAQTLLKTKEKEQKELSTKQKISQINKKIRITNRFRFASRNVKPNMKKAIKIQEIITKAFIDSPKKTFFSEKERRKKLGLEFLLKKNLQEIKNIKQKSKEKLIKKLSPEQKPTKARTSHNPEEIKAFIEIKRKEIEETNFTNILQYYLTHQKIQNNLKNLFKKSRQILQKSNILISKKPQNTSPKLPLGKIINDEKNFQDFDKNFSLIHKEYEKIMASWKKGEKLNEKPFETNGKFLQTAFFHETSVKNKAKAKSILNKFMIISKKLEKMLDSKSPNSFPKKEDIFFKQQGNNFLQILKEEEDKSSQSLIEEIGCILKNSQNSKYPKTIAEKQEFFSAKEIDRKKKLSDKISNKFQTSDNFNDSNSPKLNIFEKEYFNSKNKQLTLSQKPSHSSNNSGGLFFDSFDANKEKYITISVEELNIQKNEISYEVDEEILKENLLILENIAILIQKTWRGYKTRKIISKYFEMFLEKEENEHEIIYEEEFEDIGVESVHNNAKKGALMSSLEGLEVKFDKEIEKINEFINKKKSEHKQDHISESSLNNKNDQKYLTINNNDGNGNNVEKNLKDIGYIKISNDNDNVAFNCNNSKEIEINKKNMKKSKEREAIIRDVDNENKNDFFINNVDNEIKYEKINFTNKENKYTNDIANKNNIDLEFSCSKKEKENEINLSELRIIFGSEQYLRNFKRQLQKSAILDASQMSQNIFVQDQFSNFKNRLYLELRNEETILRKSQELRENLLKSNKKTHKLPVQKSPVIILKSKEVEAWVESDLKCKKTKKNHCLIDFPEQTKKDFILREKHRILSDDYSSILERKHQEEKNERWALSRSCHLLPTSEREGKGLFDPKISEQKGVSSKNSSFCNSKDDSSVLPKSELFGDASIISKSKKGRNETDSNHFISEEDNLDSLTPLKNISCNEHSTLKEIIDSIKVEKKVEKENYKKVFITNAVGNMILDILISEVEEEIKKKPIFNERFERVLLLTQNDITRKKNVTHSSNEIKSNFIQCLLPNKKNKQLKINNSAYFIEEYVNEICKYVKAFFMSDFLSRINTPYDNNIMDKLKLFQLRMLFPPKNGLIIKSLLSLSEDIFFETQKLRCKESENFENSGIIIFNRMLFDGLNEALEYFKPFDIRGKNTPWNVDAKKMTFSDINKENFAIVFDQVTMKMLDWNNNQCGLIYDNYLSEEDFEIADALKEEKIENMLCNEIFENEEKWLNYVDFEDIIKFEISDHIFSDLILETISVLPPNFHNLKL